MMLKRGLRSRFAIASLLFTVCTLAMLPSCTNNPDTRSGSGAVGTAAEAERFVADAEKRLLELNVKYSHADWIKSTYITEDTEALSAAANKEVIAATTELAKESRRFDATSVSLQFQFHRALCKEAGFTGPLYQCSIYGNKQVGEKLKQMLALGLSKPWPEALKTMTGEDKMDATAIIDYFAPLKQWLDAENQKAGAVARR